MLGRYTTGLLIFTNLEPCFLVITLALPKKGQRELFLVRFLQGFSDAVAFLANGVPFVAAPERLNYRILVLGKTHRTEDLVRIFIGAVITAVSAELFHCSFSFHSLSSIALVFFLLQVR